MSLESRIILHRALCLVFVFTVGLTEALIIAGKQLEGTMDQGLRIPINIQGESQAQTATREGEPEPEKKVFRKYNDEASRNVSQLLDSFLEGYDKRLRPNYRGPPVEIGVTMWVQSVSSISEVDMDFTVEMYFRQMWRDPRLEFDELDEELSISAEMLDRIWWPDTFFANAKSASFHTATTKNVFLRIDPKGNVLCSLRLTVTASCPMDLTYFPMDSQKCSLEIESFGYKLQDIRYFWSGADPVGVSEDVSLPQFKVISHRTIERVIKLSTGNYSRLGCELFFERSMGYYLIQIYIPSTLIVVLSWVSFWLSRSAVPARVALGITTVLTMTTLISSTNASLPKISYLKSIDVYLVTCFFMVFASLLEYAAVSYISKRCERGAVKRRDSMKEPTSPVLTHTSPVLTHTHLPPQAQQRLNHQRAHSAILCENEFEGSRRHLGVPYSRTFSNVDDMHNGNIWRRKCTHPNIAVPLEVRLTSLRDCTTECNLHHTEHHNQNRHMDPVSQAEEGLVSTTAHAPMDNCFSCRECCTIKPSTIDKYSRVVFPLIFTCFNILYWVTYLYVSVNTEDRKSFRL